MLLLLPVIDNAQAVHQNDIDGMQIEIHGQDDGEDDAGDADGSSSSSDEGREWYPITAFSPDYPVGEGWANWVNYQRYRRNVARIIGLDIDQIMQIYHVRWPPINLQTAGRQAVLVEKQGDLPTGSTHQMILIDVEFHPHRPSTAVEFVRGAYTVPDAFTPTESSVISGPCALLRHDPESMPCMAQPCPYSITRPASNQTSAWRLCAHCGATCS